MASHSQSDRAIESLQTLPFSWTQINRAAHQTRQSRRRFFILSPTQGVVDQHRSLDRAQKTLQRTPGSTYLFRIGTDGPVCLKTA